MAPYGETHSRRRPGRHEATSQRSGSGTDRINFPDFTSCSMRSSTACAAAVRRTSTSHKVAVGDLTPTEPREPCRRQGRTLASVTPSSSMAFRTPPSQGSGNRKRCGVALDKLPRVSHGLHLRRGQGNRLSVPLGIRMTCPTWGASSQPGCSGAAHTSGWSQRSGVGLQHDTAPRQHHRVRVGL